MTIHQSIVRVNPFKKNVAPKSNPFAAPSPGPTNTISRSNSFFDAIDQVVISENGEFSHYFGFIFVF